MIVTSTCPICNAEFQHGSSRNRITCSIECRKMLLDNNATTKVCHTCKKEFRIVQCELKVGKKYCSKKCFDIGQTGDKHPTWNGGHKKNSLEWSQRNREYTRHLSNARLARKKGAKGSHTLEQWQEKKKQYNHKCNYCGTEESLTKDHIIPVSRGGSDYLSNVQLLCLRCNAKKKDKLESELNLSEFTIGNDDKDKKKIGVQVHWLDGDS